MEKHKRSSQSKIEFENLNLWSCHFLTTRPQCIIETFEMTGKKFDCSSVDGYCKPCKTVFEAMGFYFYFCLRQEAKPRITDDDIKQ